MDNNNRVTGVSPPQTAQLSAISKALWETSCGTPQVDWGLRGESKVLFELGSTVAFVPSLHRDAGTSHPRRGF